MINRALAAATIFSRRRSAYLDLVRSVNGHVNPGMLRQRSQWDAGAARVCSGFFRRRDPDDAQTFFGHSLPHRGDRESGRRTRAEADDDAVVELRDGRDGRDQFQSIDRRGIVCSRIAHAMLDSRQRPAARCARPIASTCQLWCTAPTGTHFGSGIMKWMDRLFAYGSYAALSFRNFSSDSA
jgi:hypothetical protein